MGARALHWVPVPRSISPSLHRDQTDQTDQIEVAQPVHSSVSLLPRPLLRMVVLAAIAASGLAAVPLARAAQPLHYPDPVALSVAPVSGYDGDDADKAKLVTLVYPDGDGGFVHALLSVYIDAQGPDVWELDGTVRPARDVFVTRSVDDGLTWSTPVNLSATAQASSIAVDDDGDLGTPPAAYHGDSGNPRVAANGATVMVAWPDRYCDSGIQGSVRYPDAGDIEVPYACTWTARSTDGAETWAPAARLSDASRDAHAVDLEMTKEGAALVWQEDPNGLQPGEAEGPGEGGSGARVSHGTDVWFASLPLAAVRDGTPFPGPTAVTDNAGLPSPGPGSDEGVGASRPAMVLDGGTVVLAYEEGKGTGVMGAGKVVRYHVFSAFDDSLPDPTGGAGWVLSDPEENARRARVLKQSDAFKAESDLRLLVAWRQGTGNRGAPADIAARLGFIDPGEAGSTGWRPEDLLPAVDPLDPGASAAPLNLSSAAGVLAGTSEQSTENARAHRGFLRGDFVVFGYTWAEDGTLADASADANYDFYVRRSFDAGLSWEPPRNLSQSPAPDVSAVEPRLVPTAPNPDPADPLDPLRFFAAWGSEQDDPLDPSGAGLPLDVVVTWTSNGGETWARATALPDEDRLPKAAQLRASADGTRLGIIWSSADPVGGGVDVMFVPEPAGSLGVAAALLALGALARRRAG